MADSSDSVSVDMEGVSLCGKVHTFSAIVLYSACLVMVLCSMLQRNKTNSNIAF